ncbi:glycosyl hydrolase family 28 protein [Microbacterium pseudoresistens]|uniref:Polygalacturonase n=1 Tax=Microbacterium pseudoresistens TaxID=640634 RepID=A0A7Y9ESU6_9MICO|nr:glycosyl hydrolase family 28 protein [Microbacterium pseudoresistens]NYD53338.1 polygalacturonase [Microbacterium pseudoresistens]
MTTRDLVEFSPRGDGRALDTAALQNGIDAVHDDGGGTLLIGDGQYLTGGLLLRSGVTLELSAGATIIASPRYDDFREHDAATAVEGARHAMIYARDARDVGIRGRGRILGNADAYFAVEADADGYRVPHPLRPRIVLFEGCEAVTIADITIERAPIWTVHIAGCDDVAITGVTIDNDLTMANTDCIDIDGSRRVRIADCRLSSADDGVCIKTTELTGRFRRPAEHIVVTGCIVRSTSCAIKIGTETVEDVGFVVVSDCTVTANRGIGLISRDGGGLRHILVSGVTFDCPMAGEAYWGKADPVFVSAGRRVEGVDPGVIEHVRFSGLSGVADGAINVHAGEGGRIRDIVFDGVRLVQRHSPSPLQGQYDTRPVASSETGPGAAPGGGTTGVDLYPGGLPGVFARGVEELTLRDVEVFRPDPLPAGWNSQTIVEVP